MNVLNASELGTVHLKMARSSLVALWVKDLALSLLWLGSLAWELLHATGAAKKEKKKKS